MESRFSYYDFVANIVPAGFLILCLYYLWVLSLPAFSQNEIIWWFLSLIWMYVLWLVLQYLAKIIIEELILKGIIRKWFYSEKLFENPNSGFSKMIIAKSVQCLWITEDRFRKLDKMTTEEKKELSHEVYKLADNYTKDRNLWSKGHTANHMYSLFRGLALCSLMVSVIQIWLIIIDWRLCLIIWLVLFLLITRLFIHRTKERWEYYIKNLFYSLSK